MLTATKQKTDFIVYNEERLKNDIAANCGRRYQQCAISVMDTIADPDIRFDEKGISNYYYEFLEAEKNYVLAGKKGEEMLAKSVDLISKKGKGKTYNCILGLSGGADSTYLAYLSKELGLKPLLVHFDYGWNSETAVKNIENVTKSLGLDLYTYVMDWEEFKDLQRSYFKASVLDLDVPADHMIFGALYKIANKFGIQFLLSGNNIVTEYTLPRTWNYNKFDLTNLKNIHSNYGKLPLKNLPALGVWHTAYYQLVKNIQSIQLLNYVPYNKKEIKKTIVAKVDWRDYGGKHHESVFTRFYQGYILPTKFSIDKRKAHLSTLIFSGQLTKDEALNELQQPIYELGLQKEDKHYVAKKLGFSESEFHDVLTQSNRSHESFGTDVKEREFYYNLMKTIRPVSKMIKKLR